MAVCAENNVSIINIEEACSDNVKWDVIKMIRNLDIIKKCKTTNVEMRIILKDKKPIFCNYRSILIKERCFVNNQIEKWLGEEITESSESEFCTPVVLANKDSTPRMCIDFRRINKVTVKDHYPLPLIESQLDLLQNACIFNTITYETDSFMFR